MNNEKIAPKVFPNIHKQLKDQKIPFYISDILQTTAKTSDSKCLENKLFECLSYLEDDVKLKNIFLNFGWSEKNKNFSQEIKYEALNEYIAKEYQPSFFRQIGQKPNVSKATGKCDNEVELKNYDNYLSKEAEAAESAETEAEKEKEKVKNEYLNSIKSSFTESAAVKQNGLIKPANKNPKNFLYHNNKIFSNFSKDQQKNNQVKSRQIESSSNRSDIKSCQAALFDTENENIQSDFLASKSTTVAAEKKENPNLNRTGNAKEAKETLSSFVEPEANSNSNLTCAGNMVQSGSKSYKSLILSNKKNLSITADEDFADEDSASIKKPIATTVSSNTYPLEFSKIVLFQNEQSKNPLINYISNFNPVSTNSSNEENNNLRLQQAMLGNSHPNLVGNNSYKNNNNNNAAAANNNIFNYCISSPNLNLNKTFNNPNSNYKNSFNSLNPNNPNNPNNNNKFNSNNSNNNSYSSSKLNNFFPESSSRSAIDNNNNQNEMSKIIITPKLNKITGFTPTNNPLNYLNNHSSNNNNSNPAATFNNKNNLINNINNSAVPISLESNSLTAFNPNIHSNPFLLHHSPPNVNFNSSSGLAKSNFTKNQSNFSSHASPRLGLGFNACSAFNANPQLKGGVGPLNSPQSTKSLDLNQVNDMKTSNSMNFPLNHNLYYFNNNNYNNNNNTNNNVYNVSEGLRKNSINNASSLNSNSNKLLVRSNPLQIKGKNLSFYEPEEEKEDSAEFYYKNRKNETQNIHNNSNNNNSNDGNKIGNSNSNQKNISKNNEINSNKNFNYKHNYKYNFNNNSNNYNELENHVKINLLNEYKKKWINNNNNKRKNKYSLKKKKINSLEMRNNKNLDKISTINELKNLENTNTQNKIFSSKLIKSLHSEFITENKPEQQWNPNVLVTSKEKNELRILISKKAFSDQTENSALPFLEQFSAANNNIITNDSAAATVIHPLEGGRQKRNIQRNKRFFEVIKNSINKKTSGVVVAAKGFIKRKRKKICSSFSDSNNIKNRKNIGCVDTANNNINNDNNKLNFYEFMNLGKSKCKKRKSSEQDECGDQEPSAPSGAEDSQKTDNNTQNNFNTNNNSNKNIENNNKINIYDDYRNFNNDDYLNFNKNAYSHPTPTANNFIAKKQRKLLNNDHKPKRAYQIGNNLYNKIHSKLNNNSNNSSYQKKALNEYTYSNFNPNTNKDCFSSGKLQQLGFRLKKRRAKGQKLVLREAKKARQTNQSRFFSSRNSSFGLKEISKNVLKIVKRCKSTSYKEISDLIVTNINADLNGTKDEKNIRRRIYDSLNVMKAMNLFKNEKNLKKIVFNNSVQNAFLLSLLEKQDSFGCAPLNPLLQQSKGISLSNKSLLPFKGSLVGNEKLTYSFNSNNHTRNDITEKNNFSFNQNNFFNNNNNNKKQNFFKNKNNQNNIGNRNNSCNINLIDSKNLENSQRDRIDAREDSAVILPPGNENIQDQEIQIAAACAENNFDNSLYTNDSKQPGKHKDFNNFHKNNNTNISNNSSEEPVASIINTLINYNKNNNLPKENEEQTKQVKSAQEDIINRQTNPNLTPQQRKLSSESNSRPLACNNNTDPNTNLNKNIDLNFCSNNVFKRNPTTDKPLFDNDSYRASKSNLPANESAAGSNFIPRSLNNPNANLINPSNSHLLNSNNKNNFNVLQNNVSFNYANDLFYSSSGENMDDAYFKYKNVDSKSKKQERLKALIVILFN